MAGGGVAYCRTDVARRWRPGSAELGPILPQHDGRRSAITAPGVAAVLAVMLALSIGFGQLDTSMAATAGERLGGTDKVGLLFAAIAGGSTIGGLAFGTRRWPFDERRAVAVLLALFAVFLAAMAALVSVPSSPLWLMFPLLFLTGCTIAPTLIMQQSLMDHLAPAHRLNEAQAFLSAATTTGGAMGTAIAGFIIDGWGLTASFGGAAVGAAIAAAIALASQSHWRRAAAER
jgi:predicted MFS family arabinose efflux permease